MTEVSVVIPTYNRESVVVNAIRSVLSQSFQDFEIVVVDDGSQDSTETVLKEMKDSRIIYIQHSKNLGTAQARNTGIKNSKGKYVAFLDSDDEWLPEKLSKQMETIGEYEQDIIANVSGFYLFDEFGIKRKQIPKKQSSWFKHLLMGCGLGEGATLLVSKNAFEKVGWFNSSLPRYGDWEWLLRYTKSYNLTITPEPLAVVHRDTRPSAEKVELAAKRFLELHLHDFKQFGYYGKRAIGKRYLEVAVHYYLAGDKKNGKKWLHKAISQSIFQRPGMYLRIFDAVYGTSIIPTLINFRNSRNSDVEVDSSQ